MTLQDRRTYCKVCQHHKFDDRTGIYCGLSQEKPSFIHFCSSFQEDPNLRHKEDVYLSNSFKAEQKAVLPLEKDVKDALEGFLPDQLLIKKGNPLARYYLLIRYFILMGVLFFLLDYRLVLFIMTTLFGVYFTYSRSKKNKENLAYINSRELNLYGRSINLDRLQAFYIQSIDDKRSLHLKILGRKETIEVNISNLDMPSRTFLSYLEAYRRKNRQNLNPPSANF